MKKTIIIAICIIMIISISGCLKTRDKALEQIKEDELRPVSSILLSEEDALRLNEKLQVRLYFADQDGTRLVKEIRYIDMNDAKQGTEQQATLLVKELVKGPSNSTLNSTMPEGASLRSPIKVENRTATVDMTKEFVDNHPGGKEAEEMTIFSIVNTLTELKDIETVKFLINGKTQKEFKGNFLLNNEFPRNEALIDRKQSQSVIPDSGEIGDDTVEVNADDVYEDEILE
ncbi:MAG: GerMN domain-containing protein [Ruminiclostridium sp.]|nr:GerMN domain-containing protein [Ruminiclostridium sp.]